MKIGVDISPLQGPHRMRGVGFVIINLINNISNDDKEQHEFVFYMEPDEITRSNALELLELSKMEYEIRGKPAFKNPEPIKLPSNKLRLLAKSLNKLIALPRFKRGIVGYDSSGLDIFLLTDQIQIMPYMPKVKKVMIAYDLIPYILEWEYLWSYKTARRHGLKRKGAIAAALRRKEYIKKIKINAKKSFKIITISEQTRSDFMKRAQVPSRKIKVIHLGVSPSGSGNATPNHVYKSTSWGYFKQPFVFNAKTPFILYVGGTDARRKLDDLVTAFNHLRAQGHELKLVLSGDILQGPKNLSVKDSRHALLNSSYSDDIIYMGFTEEQEKNWLYKHALAFVYPSIYEGFGLPVLEAMAQGCPVICYKNSSISEIAGDAAMYAHDSFTITESVKVLLNSVPSRKSIVKKGYNRAAEFSWQEAASQLIAAFTV